MPWNYRQGQRVNSSSSNSETNTNRLPTCVDDDCDCFDFASQKQAQRVLERFSGDPHRLDGDGNGIACESLD